MKRRLDPKCNCRECRAAKRDADKFRKVVIAVIVTTVVLTVARILLGY